MGSCKVQVSSKSVKWFPSRGGKGSKSAPSHRFGRWLICNSLYYRIEAVMYIYAAYFRFPTIIVDLCTIHNASDFLAAVAVECYTFVVAR